MKAFHNDTEVRNKYLTRIRDHQKADEFIKGTYWEEGKGCAVGCTVHSSNHKAYEDELGIPMWLARIEDQIFEGLPNARAKEWPVEFLEAINLGADLDKIKIPFLIFICEQAKTHTKNELAHSYIDGVITELKKETINMDLLRKARAASRPRYAADADAASDAAAVYAAEAAAAADASASAAYAVYAVYAAEAAAAADAAADAASDAASDAAARESQYVKFANNLLELVRECKDPSK